MPGQTINIVSPSFNAGILAEIDGDSKTNIPLETSYTPFRVEPDRVTYVAQDHEMDNRHQLQLARTLATASGNYRGSAKTRVKLNKDVMVTGRDGNPIQSQIILTVEMSVPLGVGDQALHEELGRLCALLGAYNPTLWVIPSSGETVIDLMRGDNSNPMSNWTRFRALVEGQQFLGSSELIPA